MVRLISLATFTLKKSLFFFFSIMFTFEQCLQSLYRLHWTLQTFFNFIQLSLHTQTCTECAVSAVFIHCVSDYNCFILSFAVFCEKNSTFVGALGTSSDGSSESSYLPIKVHRTALISVTAKRIPTKGNSDFLIMDGIQFSVKFQKNHLSIVVVRCQMAWIRRRLWVF